MTVKETRARERREPDYMLILAVVALSLLGLLMVYSTTCDWGYLASGNPFQQVARQALWLVLGGGLTVFLARTDYSAWRRFALPLLGGTLAVLVVLLVIGDWMWGARRSFLNGSVQPGELAKLTTVVYAAAWISSKGDQIRDVTYGLIPFAVWVGVIAGLVVLQPDLSAAVTLVAAGFAVFFLAGAHPGPLFIAGLQDPSQLAYQPREALYALANGGLFGTGLGDGREKFYLPMAHNDTIFAVVGEELGLLGCLLVVALFVLLAWRGFRIALRAQDRFGSLLACGLTCLLIFQAVLNMGTVTSLVPFTGTTLPFISMGGSSLGVSLVAVGLLLSISRGRPPREWRDDALLDRGRRDGRARLPRTGRPARA